MFIAPSRFLLERYVDWGIPRDRILLEHHGFPPAERVEAPDRDPRNRFAFFGVMTPFKGIDVLLRAMERLGPGFDGHVSVHGAELQRAAARHAGDARPSVRGHVGHGHVGRALRPRPGPARA